MQTKIVITLCTDKEWMMKMKMLALVFSSLIAQSAFAAAEVNVYSTRQDELIKPIIQQFEKETGINTVMHMCMHQMHRYAWRKSPFWGPADKIASPAQASGAPGGCGFCRCGDGFSKMGCCRPGSMSQRFLMNRLQL